MSLLPRSFSLAVFPVALAILLCSVSTNSSFAQSQSETTGKRRLVERTEPIYPQLARTLRLEGVVRLEAVVSPEGNVKTVGIKGGHPVLADSAVNAVRQWKWERASQESRELVEVKFSRPD